MDGVQCVQGQMKQSVFKCIEQDQGGVQGVKCHVLNNVIQIRDHDHLWRSMIENDNEIQGDQKKMYTSIQGVHGKK